MTVEIRQLQESDLQTLCDLYNYYILETPATFDIVPKPVTWWHTWFETISKSELYHGLAAVDGDTLLGVAWSTPMREKQAYQTSILTSIYLSVEARGRGVGPDLYRTLFAAHDSSKVHKIFAGITQPNERSNRLHEKLGFEEEGVFKEVGKKFDQFWDVRWMARNFTL